MESDVAYVMSDLFMRHPNGDDKNSVINMNLQVRSEGQDINIW